MRRTKEDAQATRHALLDAALELFSTRGYAATRLEDVAREAGVTRGAVYWHFGSKADLYAALHAEIAETSAEVVHQVVAGGGSHVQIWRRLFVRLLEVIEEDRRVRAVLEIRLFRSDSSPELAATAAEQREAARVMTQQVAQFLALGVEAGELRADLDPLDAARTFLALQDGLAFRWLSDPGSFSLATAAGPAADIFLRGIQA